MKKSDTPNRSIPQKPPANKPAGKVGQPAAAPQTWGTEAAKTVARFRKIWEKEGAKLA